MKLTVEIFEKEIMKMINKAKEENRAFIDVTSKEVHMLVGGYPSRNHAMPSCCRAMRNLMKEKDHIKHEPPKGNGATVEIRYYI